MSVAPTAWPVEPPITGTLNIMMHERERGTQGEQRDLTGAQTCA